MRVLIIKLSSIGDVVHTIPALKSLREGFRDAGVKAEVDWLVEEPASSILRDRPDIDNVIVVKRRGWTSNFSENLRVARRLASRNYDMVLDFQGLLKSGVWVLLSRGKRRVGFSNYREMSHVFLNEKLPPYDLERHAVDRYMDLARHAGGAEADPSRVAIEPSPEAWQTVKKKLGSRGVDPEGPFFVLCTQARWPTKLWGDGRFAELARRVLERHGAEGLKAVLVGGPGDKARLEAIRDRTGDQAKRVANLAGETSLRELAELTRRARFIVTVDSGPMHLAAAAGARVVSLFGPTAPWRTGPYGPGHVVVRKALECSPCLRRECREYAGGPRCMDDITVEDVMGAIEAELKGSAAGGGGRRV